MSAIRKRRRAASRGWLSEGRKGRTVCAVGPFFLWICPKSAELVDGYVHGIGGESFKLAFWGRGYNVGASDAIVPAQSILIEHAPEISESDGKGGEK